MNKIPALEQAAQDVNSRNIPYNVMSTNCNRAAYHVLKTAGVKTKNPVGFYVGWGKMLKAKKKKKKKDGQQDQGGTGGADQRRPEDENDPNVQAWLLMLEDVGTTPEDMGFK